MEDRFNFTINHLKMRFNDRLEIDTKEVVEILGITICTLSRRMKYGETHLIPKYRISGDGRGKKSCGKYKWPIYDLAIFLTQDIRSAS